MQWDCIIKLLSPFLTVVIAFLLNQYFSKKSKLITYYGHISIHKMELPDEKEHIVHTHTIVIKNIGKLSAKNVRVGHHWLGKNYTVVPNVKYEVLDLQSGGKELLFSILVPNEEITISYIYYPPITFQNINSYVKSDEGFARIINVIPSPNLPFWQKAISYILLFIGTSTVIYSILYFVSKLLQTTHSTC